MDHMDQHNDSNMTASSEDFTHILMMASLRHRLRENRETIKRCWQTTTLQRIHGRAIGMVLMLCFFVNYLTNVPTTQDVNKSASYDQQQNEQLHTRGVSPPVSIVVALYNEMGNELSYLAYGRAIQLWAKRQHGIDTELVLRQGQHWVFRGSNNRAKRCFPALRSFNFTLASGSEFDVRMGQQRKWLGNETSDKLTLRTTRFEEIDESLSILKHWMGRTDQIYNNSLSNGESSIISLPFLLVEFQVMYDAIADKFYDDFREFYKFNRRRCCTRRDGVRPYENETVFHFRNYATELKERAKRYGFAELDANRTAQDLFGNLGYGDSMAITSRFSSDPSMDAYVDALRSRGIEVRVIQNQSDEQDFCFLMRTKKELVSIAESTFAMWAGYLGNPEKIRLYNVDCPSRRGDESLFRSRVNFHYNWTNPKLKSKVFFELHKVNEE